MRGHFGRFILAGPILLALVPTGADAQFTREEWKALTQARAALWRDPKLADLDIAVIIDSSRFRLRGTVPSEELKRHAAEVVQKANGGREVWNSLRVEPIPGGSEWNTTPDFSPPAKDSFLTAPNERLGGYPYRPGSLNGDHDGWRPNPAHAPAGNSPTTPRPTPRTDGWAPYTPSLGAPRLPSR